MQTASSAKRTWSALRSASEYTATVAMPSSLHASMTRRAISPRLAMRIFRNISGRKWRSPAAAGLRGFVLARPKPHRLKPAPLLLFSRGPQRKQRFAVLHRLAVFDQNSRHFPADLRFNLVHQFHGFDYAYRLARLDKIPHANKRSRVGTRPCVECADDGRLNDVLVRGCGWSGLSRPRNGLR